jgi:hypothetical protein
MQAAIDQLSGGARRDPSVVDFAPGQDDSRAQRFGAPPYRGSFVLQQNGVRGTVPLPPDYGAERPVQTFTLHEGHWVVFAKLNIINPSTTAKVSVTFELHAGTRVDTYEMLDIMPQSMRLASLMVGANLTADTEARLVYRLPKPEPPPTSSPIITVNLTIASIKLAELLIM